MRIELALESAQFRFRERGLRLVTLDLEAALAFKITDTEINPGPEGEDDEVVEDELNISSENFPKTLDRLIEDYSVSTIPI